MIKLPRLRTILLALFYLAGAVVLFFDDGTIAPMSGPPSNFESVVIFGASGTAGDGILKAVMANPDIEVIHVVTRRLTPRIEAGVASGKVVVSVHQDYLDYSAVHDQIAAADISFHYISSSDISADSRMMWAREKVRAEETLFESARRSKLRVITYRPDYIGPTREETHPGQVLLYWFFVPVGAAVKATQIGEAMLEVTSWGAEFANGERLGTRSIIRYSDAYARR